MTERSVSRVEDCEHPGYMRTFYMYVKLLSFSVTTTKSIVIVKISNKNSQSLMKVSVGASQSVKINENVDYLLRVLQNGETFPRDKPSVEISFSYFYGSSPS